MTTNFYKHWCIRYGMALAIVVGAVLARMALVPVLGLNVPYVTIYPAIMVVAVMFGVGPGVFASLVGILLAEQAFMRTESGIAWNLSLAIRATIVLGASLYLGWIGQKLRAARARAETETAAARAAEQALRLQVELVDPARTEIIAQEMRRMVRERELRAAPPAPEKTSSLQTVPRVAGMAVTGVGLLVLAGWIFDHEALKRVWPGLVAMKANAALCFVLAGVALLLRNRNAWRTVLAGAICAIATLTLLEYVAGIELGLDQLLFREYNPLQTTSPGRMAPTTAIAFAFVSIALLFLQTKRNAARTISQTLSLLAGTIGLMAMIGYFYRAPGFYAINGTTSMALHTAVLFVILSGGLVFARTDGLASVLTGTNPGAQLARRLLPTVLLAPPVLGRLFDAGIQQGIYSDPSGTILFSLSMMLSLAALILWTARALARADVNRQESETQLRNQSELMDQSMDALIVREVDGTIRCWNRGAERLYGWLAAEAAGQRIHVLLRTEGRSPHHEARLQQTGHWEGELTHTTRDGNRVIVESRKTAIRTEAGKVLILESNRDITDRRKAEAEAVRLESERSRYAAKLEESNTTLDLSRRAAINLMDDAVTARKHAEQISAELRMEVAEHQHAEEALAISIRRTELLAETASRLLSTPDPQQAVEELCSRVMAFLDCQVFFNFLATDAGTAAHSPGRLHLNACAGIPAEEARRIEWLEFGVAVCGCVARERQRIVAEDVQNTPDPRTELVKSYGIQAYCCHPLTIADRLIGTLSFGTRSRGRFSADDLALMKSVSDLVSIAMERMLAARQLRRTAEDLARSNRDLEQFAYAASHDLQEPLRMVTGFGDLLRTRYADALDERGREYVDHLTDNARRMRALVEGLLEYSRAGVVEIPVENLDAQAALDAALANLQTAVTETDAIVTSDLLPRVRIERTELTQLFQNLIGNAIKFRRAGARPEVHVDARKVSTEEHGRWLFSVKDNGIGIAPEFQERIFVIFQRLHTREEYSGTGIGLAICKKIVERHGGRIRVESEPGKGSTFLFTLPE